MAQSSNVLSLKKDCVVIVCKGKNKVTKRRFSATAVLTKRTIIGSTALNAKMLLQVRALATQKFRPVDMSGAKTSGSTITEGPYVTKGTSDSATVFRQCLHCHRISGFHSRPRHYTSLASLSQVPISRNSDHLSIAAALRSA